MSICAPCLRRPIYPPPGCSCSSCCRRTPAARPKRWLLRRLASTTPPRSWRWPSPVAGGCARRTAWNGSTRRCGGASGSSASSPIGSRPFGCWGGRAHGAPRAVDDGLSLLGDERLLALAPGPACGQRTRAAGGSERLMRRAAGRRAERPGREAGQATQSSKGAEERFTMPHFSLTSASLTGSPAPVGPKRASPMG
jgi:hypothetical protein